MSIWRTLFGGGERAAAQPKVGETIEYNGFTIQAAPLHEGGKWLTAGLISKAMAGETKTHRFVRADSHATFEQAASFSLDKGRQIVDLMGERVFNA